jgi:ferredoxin
MSGKMVRLTLDAEACIGVGQCELLEPEVFRLDDDENISVFVGDPQLPRDRAEIVVDKCPSGAIQIAQES